MFLAGKRMYVHILCEFKIISRKHESEMTKSAKAESKEQASFQLSGFSSEIVHVNNPHWIQPLFPHAAGHFEPDMRKQTIIVYLQVPTKKWFSSSSPTSKTQRAKKEPILHTCCINIVCAWRIFTDIPRACKVAPKDSPYCRKNGIAKDKRWSGSTLLVPLS
jgi:hypothetical protein